MASFIQNNVNTVSSSIQLMKTSLLLCYIS